MNRSEHNDDAVDRQHLSADQADPSVDGVRTVQPGELEGDEQEIEIERLRDEAERNLDNYQRAVADLANYRRRKEQETLRVAEHTRRALLKQFLPVADDLERAVKAAGADDAAASWVEGFSLIERKLWSILEAAGVRPMNAVGETFDPQYHDAVQVEDGADSPDTVVEELARGYFIGDDVLRPAMVKVGKSNVEADR